MTITELSDRIDRALARIDAELQAQGQKAGLDLVALVSTRVIQRGETADGGRFSNYSEKPTPAFFYFGKSRNQAGERAVQKASKDRRPLSYSEFRRVNGLEVSFKNFEFTGALWRGFGVKSVESSPEGVAVTIGGMNTDAAQKIQWLSEQEGQSIIQPSPAEIDLVKGFLVKWASGLIQ